MTGSLMFSSPPGAAPTAIAMLGSWEVVALLDPDFVYVSVGQFSSNPAGFVRVPRTGGPPEIVSATNIDAIAVDDSSLYFYDPFQPGLWKETKTGGSRVLLSNQGAGQAATDGRWLYWTSIDQDCEPGGESMCQKPMRHGRILRVGV